MASLSQKIKYIEKRINQKDLASLSGASARYIRKIKSKEKSGAKYADVISNIYENLKVRKSPPTKKYKESEVIYLKKEIKAYEKELKIKPAKTVSFSLSTKNKINKGREKYKSITLNFKNTHFMDNTDYVLEKSINQLKKYKFDIGFGNLVLSKAGASDVAGIYAFTDIDSFIINFNSAIENIFLKGQYFSGDAHRKIDKRKKKKVYMDTVTDSKLMINKISLRLYK